MEFQQNPFGLNLSHFGFQFHGNSNRIQWNPLESVRIQWSVGSRHSRAAEGHCLVVFGKGIRVETFVHIHHRKIKLLRFSLAFEPFLATLGTSPSGDESVIKPTVFYCVHLCFPHVLHAFPTAIISVTCQPPGGTTTFQRSLGHPGET